jgi:hypothetical protein
VTPLDRSASSGPAVRARSARGRCRKGRHADRGDGVERRDCLGRSRAAHPVGGPPEEARRSARALRAGPWGSSRCRTRHARRR